MSETSADFVAFEPLPNTHIADLERQLAEAQGKLEAVRAEAHDWMDSESAWYCRSKIDAILGERG